MRIKINPTIILLLGLLLGFILAGGSIKAQASTIYETAGPDQNRVVDFANDGYGLSRYVYRFRVPVGVSFDRIQITASTTDIGRAQFYLMQSSSTLSYDRSYELCNDASCTNDDQQIEILGLANPVKTGDLIQYSQPTITTITDSRQYLMLILDPNTPFTLWGIETFSNGIMYSENGFNNLRQRNGPSFRLCNSFCDSTEFSPIPTLTATPWVRISNIFLQPGTQSTYRLDIETNTGTSTGDNIQIRYVSNFQSLTPDNINIVTSGIQRDSLIKAFPVLNDTIQIEISFREGTTTIAVSPTYTINTSGNILDSGGNSDQVCDITGGTFYYAICTAGVFLFSPSQSSLDRFATSYNQIINVKPFGYFTLAVNAVKGVNASSTPAYTMPEIPFISAIFDPLKTATATILWGVFAFVFYNKRLKHIEI